MNRGHLLQSSPVQQMMAAGSPAGWWNINNMRAASAAAPPQEPSQQHIPNQLIPNNSSHFIPTLPSWADHCQEMPESWTQLLSGGLVGGEDEQKTGAMEAAKKMQNWEEQVLLQQQQQPQSENSANGYNLYENAEFHASAVARSAAAWSQMMPVSSPNSCVTTLSSNMLDFSSNKSPEPGRNPVLPDPSSECNSTGNLGGGAAKKARVQPSSSTQSSFKVRKEKLGDRITALHQLVSPFGKTDTASVLLEAIGYIRFLQGQIEALSLPYLATSKSGNNPRQQQHHVQGGERNCLFPEDPGQLVNENIVKIKAIFDQGCEEEEAKKDLRSRGLCLVPISCTLQVGSDNGADYWAPALGGGGGFR